MKPLPLFLCCSILLLLTGCYTAKVLPFAGDQQDWPTATGSFVAKDMPLPVYYGYPPKPYTYLSQILINARHPSVDAVKTAANLAKSNGADALLIIEDTERPVGTSGFGSGIATGQRGQAYAFGSGFGAVQYGGQAKAIAIKFK